jgi:non-specific serine/threonine protein kinase
MREYAGEKLAASGERTALRNRHRDWYLHLAEHAEMASRRREQKQWLTRLEAEIDNLRAALAWCQEAADADPDSDAAAAGLRLAAALFWLWQWRGYSGEGQQWLEGALARGSRCPPALRANALVCMAHLNAAARQHMGLARQEQEKAVLLARAGGEAREIALAVLQLSEIVSLTYDWEAAGRYAAEARERLEALGDRSRLVRAVHILAHAAGGRGDWEGRRRLLEELTGLCRETGDHDILVHVLGGLGHLARDAGDLAHARTLYGESLVLRREIGNLFAVAQALEDLAVLAGRERDAERAIRLLGASEVYCETFGAQAPVTIAAEYEPIMAEGRATLGEAAFAAAWTEGRAMALEQAIEYALLAPRDPPPAA